MSVYIYSGTCSDCGKVRKVVVMIEGSRALENPLTLRCDNREEHESKTSELVHLALDEVC